MKVSELIAELEAIRQAYGDIAVDHIDDGDMREVFSTYVKTETYLDAPTERRCVIY